ncbi:MAG: phosphotransferase family protein, partial [Acidobacteriota bacterium]
MEPLRLICPVTSTASGERRSGFDLAVASDPSRETLEAAWSALASRGSLYTEWRGSLSGGWRAAAAKLRLAGFEDVECFWARPDPSRAPATVWIPLEAREPFDYYRTRRRGTRNPVRLAGRAVRRIQWMLRPRRPVCAAARKPAPPGSPRSEEGESWIETIRNAWSDWGLGPAPRRIFRLLQAMPGRSSGKVLAFLFADGDAAPRLVVKMARTAESAAGLRREGEVLRALERRAGGVAGVPRILLSRPDGILVETALPGLPLSSFLSRRSYRELAEKATSWLADFAGPDDGSREPCGGFVDRVLADFVSHFGSALDPGVLRGAEQLLAKLPPLRRVCEQRDFSPWNILLVPDGTLSVLDWESSELHGLPGLDLIYFLTYLALYFDHSLRSGRHRESYRRSLEPSSLTGSAAKSCLARYCDRTSLPGDTLRPLRVLAWLLHSRSEYRHLTEDAGGPPDA